MSAVADLQSWFEQNGYVDGSSDWPSVRRRVHDGTSEDPVHRLVIFTEDGGVPPETPADAGSQGDAAWRRPQVQVRVRGAPWSDESPDVAEEKAEELWDAVHGLNAVVMGDVEYIGTRCLTELIPLGFDEQNRPEFTFSVQMTRPVRVPASL